MMDGLHARAGLIRSWPPGPAIPESSVCSWHYFTRPGRARRAPPTVGRTSINILYSPWKVTNPEPGYSGVVMRKGPYPDANPIYNASTNLPVVIPVNHHFARSSLRDGGVASDCPDPGLRPSVNGYVWSYWPDYAKQGWVPCKVGGVTYSVEDNTYTGTLCGPARFDFDCRYPHEACPLYHECGGSPPPVQHRLCLLHLQPGDPGRHDTRRTGPEEVLPALAADSTTFGWLVPGDVVRRDCYTTSGTYLRSCVVVQCAKYLPNGCRGWVRSDALGAAIDAGQGGPVLPVPALPGRKRSVP